MKKQADPTAKPAGDPAIPRRPRERRVRNGQRMADQGCTRITERRYLRLMGSAHRPKRVILAAVETAALPGRSPKALR